MIKIGNIIADEMEFKPFYDNMKNADGFKESQLNGDKAIEAVIRFGSEKVLFKTVLSGIGKVCAASAAAFLIADGCDMILNSGLSGAVSKVSKGDIVIGTSYQITDFDLSPLGRKKGELSGMISVFDADVRLVAAFENAVPYAKKGKLATGDIFVAEKALKLELKEVFGATACDMESAAIALTCYKGGIPFVSVRRISDDADDAACDSYNEMNDKAEDTLYGVTVKGLTEYFSAV